MEVVCRGKVAFEKGCFAGSTGDEVETKMSGLDVMGAVERESREKLTGIPEKRRVRACCPEARFATWIARATALGQGKTQDQCPAKWAVW